MLFVSLFQKKFIKSLSSAILLQKECNSNSIYNLRNYVSSIQLDQKEHAQQSKKIEQTIQLGNELNIQHATLERKERLKNISQALKFYLNNLDLYEKMIEKEKIEFELGKRHLANIMGWPGNMKITQNDIDRAINYLFPSGLSDKKAVPVMKPPEEIMPKFKKMEFDEECRPKNYLFYTIHPKFYGLMSKINENTLHLVKLYNKNSLKEGVNLKNLSNTDTSASKLVLAGSEWLSKEALTKKYDERITDDMYASFIIAMDYLISLPQSHLYKDFIQSNRQALAGEMTDDITKRKIFGCKIPAVQLDPVAENCYSIGRGKVKKMVYDVKVNNKGSGKFFIDGQHYSEIRSLLAREVLLAPLIVTGLLGKVDVDATLVKNVTTGPMLVARTVRHGTSLALAALFPKHREKLRLTGLLTWDPRKTERKKISQPGARAKWIWKKR